MFSYTFSRREKALLVVFAAILVFVAWYMLVFQRTTNEITRMQNERADVETQITVETTKAAQMRSMQGEIEQLKAEGVQPLEVPQYDNMANLMREFQTALGAADTYTLSFDEIKDTGGKYVNRGVQITFGCGSYDVAKDIVKALAGGRYPCSLDEVSMSSSTSRTASRVASSSSGSAYAVTVHLTYYERP